MCSKGLHSFMFRKYTNECRDCSAFKSLLFTFIAEYICSGSMAWHKKKKKTATCLFRACLQRLLFCTIDCNNMLVGRDASLEKSFNSNGVNMSIEVHR